MGALMLVQPAQYDEEEARGWGVAQTRFDIDTQSISHRARGQCQEVNRTAVIYCGASDSPAAHTARALARCFRAKTQKVPEVGEDSKKKERLWDVVKQHCSRLELLIVVAPGQNDVLASRYYQAVRGSERSFTFVPGEIVKISEDGDVTAIPMLS